MKRYTVTMDFYIHAGDDKHAKALAEHFASEMRHKEDNQAAVVSIHETPFASLPPFRKVEL